MIRSLMISRLALVALAVAAMTSCSKNEEEDDIIAPPVNPNETIISGTLAVNKTLTAEKT